MQYCQLGDTVYFAVGVNNTSGSGANGATGVYDVREAGASGTAVPVLSGSGTNITGTGFPAGCWEVAVAATSGNGFAVNKTYFVFFTLAVDSQNPTGMIGSFRTAPVPANRIQDLGAAIQVGDITLTTGTSSGRIVLPTTDNYGNAIADDDRFVWSVFRIDSGTGAGQVLVTTLQDSDPFSYLYLTAFTSVAPDTTSVISFLHHWMGNTTYFGNAAGTFASGRPEVNTSHAAGTAWGSGAITASSIASDAITAAKIADGAIDAATLATGTITAAKFAAGAIDAAAIADGAIDQATFAAIPSVNVTQISGDSTAADNAEIVFESTGIVGFERALRVIAYGTVTTGASTTSIPTSAMTPAAGSTTSFVDSVLMFDKDTTTAGLRGKKVRITAHTSSATPTFTVTSTGDTPASGDTFVIQ